MRISDWSSDVCSSDLIGTTDAHDLLRLGAQAQLRGGKQAVDDVIVAANAIVDELVVAVRPDHEKRRRLALIDPCWELDIDLGAVIDGAHRPPGKPEERRAGKEGVNTGKTRWSP